MYVCMYVRQDNSTYVLLSGWQEEYTASVAVVIWLELGATVVAEQAFKISNKRMIISVPRWSGIWRNRIKWWQWIIAKDWWQTDFLQIYVHE